MKIKKLTSLIIATMLVGGICPRAFASDTIINPHSVTINGVTTGDENEPENRVKSKESLDKSGNPSFAPGAGWDSDGFVSGTIKGVATGNYNNKSKHFYNHSVTIPKGVNYSFEWFQTIQDSNQTTKAIDYGVRGQGGYKFLAEIEGHVNGNYATEETVTMQAGIKSTIGFLNAGSHTIDWYMKAKTYVLYANWKYTNDITGNSKTGIGTRAIGSIEEATKFLHVEVK